MHGRRLKKARERFVTPFYLRSLSADSLKDPKCRAEFVKGCSSIDTESAQLLLDEPEWRGRKVASWMVGVNRWEEFVPQLSRQLLESQLVYAGQGYCVGLALIATEDAQRGLVDYLERWLPELSCHYDQHWAMGALVEVDRALETNTASTYLAADGMWDRWLEAQGGRIFDAPAPVTEIVSLLRDN